MSIKLSSTATKAVQGLSAVDPGFVDYDIEMDTAITDMDRRGIDFMAVPAVKRHEAFLLDQKLTQAANENRREDFMTYLDAWRKCFH